MDPTDLLDPDPLGAVLQDNGLADADVGYLYLPTDHGSGSLTNKTLENVSKRYQHGVPGKRYCRSGGSVIR